MKSRKRVCLIHEEEQTPQYYVNRVACAAFFRSR